ncbi:NAD(P)/FAD-dependent oxidoreductase [Pontibacillus yanchengensis]|uniref:NAD(P)/FAD-dependent oxidoreductase n=2 Tax=Pontibacillus yanchengensis TaxID=462910 RepID=A0ACC7VBZ0_9BACI|nr:NAD(P)/FAD-dependent oxidoreductase [Pontibacillus yanchengensis]MYL35170.1 NAD(P)/FAD-dependent oxidoreductase [Pontibacillus yanchengensis]MYL52463.1 NAD(P)/FAD-dependent oxidoreductase [Pontibacillus yanchengensis]
MNRIVILGGGYGGVKIAQQLLSNTDRDTTITLIDRNPYHSMKTEFYALAAGTIAEKDIRSPFPKHENMRIIADEILHLNVEQQSVFLRHTEKVYYDYLIIGLGSEDNFHGIDGASEYTHKISTIKKTRQTYEAVNNMKNYGTATIVGGGLSGVEMASELRESRPDINIRLLDRGDSILKAFPESIQGHAIDWFKEHDVELVYNSKVDYVEPNILCNAGTCLLSDVTIWTAGIKPSKVVDKLDVKKDNAGRVILNDYHQIPAHQNIYVTGDCASLELPPSAQLAEQQGKQIADVLSAILRGKDPKKPSKITVKGTLGSLGKQDGFGLTFYYPLKGILPRVIKTGVLWYHKFQN